MRRNCPHCGTDQVVADEKLTAGWIFLKCHHCARTSAVQGKAALNLIRAADQPLRTKTAAVAPEVPKVPKVVDEPRILEVKHTETHHQASVTHVAKMASRVRSHALPVALALICFGSGGYLIHSAKLIRQDGWNFFSQNEPPVALVSDLVPVAIPIADAPIVTSNAAPSVVVNSAPEIAKSAQPAAAPAPTPAPRVREMKVQVRATNAVLRAGPGTKYGKVGTARAELQLLVRGTFENWIEVQTGIGSKSAWIRRDLVTPIQQVARQEAQP